MTFDTQSWLFIYEFSSEEKCAVDKASAARSDCQDANLEWVHGEKKDEESGGRGRRLIVGSVHCSGGLYDYSWLRWRKSWVETLNLTLSLMDRTQLPWEWRWEREEGREPATPPCLLLLLLSVFFPPLSPGRLSCSCRWKFWALSSCWQHPVSQLTHSGFRLLSKSRHTKLHSQPAPTPLLTRWLVPGPNATTVLTVAFDGAALLPVISSWGIWTAESRGRPSLFYLFIFFFWFVSPSSSCSLYRGAPKTPRV